MIELPTNKVGPISNHRFTAGRSNESPSFSARFFATFAPLRFAYHPQKFKRQDAKEDKFSR
jgi:hypothetical protein